MLAVVQPKTVNLASLVRMPKDKTQADSCYRRAQRFLQAFRVVLTSYSNFGVFGVRPVLREKVYNGQG